MRVGVIFGGRSAEHEVSLNSARSIMKVIDPVRYEVVPIGITRGGRWLASGDPMKALQEAAEEASSPAAILADPSHRGLVRIDRAERVTPASLSQRLDVIFPILHGPYGEDGTIQGLLELADVPYVGAGVLASALGMDKVLMKAVFAQRGLPIVDYIVVKRLEWERNRLQVVKRIEENIGFPCFVKPANLGSSVGISKARSREELGPALDLAVPYDRKLVVEKFIDCRELECSVLGNEDPEASVVGEIVPCNEFYDYKAKYVDNKSELIIPAPISESTAEEVRRTAIEAFQAIDCVGMARVDFFLGKENGRVYLNEINTIPGFTSISMYPKLWEASGVRYEELVNRLLDLALQRHTDKHRYNGLSG
ncbi:MAG: D-alanine--D-alanine ligase [Chloroflexi bacterium]|nr:D-alanine--D-alanine ligase [Chloroflexota bacterium]